MKGKKLLILALALTLLGAGCQKTDTGNEPESEKTEQRITEEKIFHSYTNPQIGCIILTDVFYFKEEDWIKML